MSYGRLNDNSYYQTYGSNSTNLKHIGNNSKDSPEVKKNFGSKRKSCIATYNNTRSNNTLLNSIVHATTDKKINADLKAIKNRYQTSMYICVSLINLLL